MGKVTTKSIEYHSALLFDYGRWEESIADVNVTELSALFRDDTFKAGIHYSTLLDRLNWFLHNTAHVWVNSVDVDRWVALWKDVVGGHLGVTQNQRWTALDAYLTSREVADVVGPLDACENLLTMLACTNVRMDAIVDVIVALNVPGDLKSTISQKLLSPAHLHQVTNTLDSATGTAVLALAWLDYDQAEHVLANIPMLLWVRELLAVERVTANCNTSHLKRMLADAALNTPHVRLNDDDFYAYIRVTGREDLAPNLAYPEVLAEYLAELSPTKRRSLLSIFDFDCRHNVWRAPNSTSSVLDDIINYSPGLGEVIDRPEHAHPSLCDAVYAYFKAHCHDRLSRQTFKQLAKTFPGTLPELVATTKASLQ